MQYKLSIFSTQLFTSRVDRKKVEKNIKDKEEKGQSVAKKIQEMQGAMQSAAAEAAKLAAQQAAQG